ncbi:MAG: oligosaccharide flippase family protein, partial [Proteobacteria bacterium]|nr:oligosaccharide flippase family protein [Pseudomonadota bacterium]
LRYSLLARLLGPEQMGLVATLIFIGQFFESVTDSGSDRFLIQDTEGDTHRVQHMVQTIFVSRGVISALAMVALAYPLAYFFKAPPLATAVMWLGLVPLGYGLLHLDMRRSQRKNDFRPEGLATIAGELTGLAVTVATAFLLHDFTAALWGLLARILAMVAVSHVLSERPYRLGFSKEDAKRILPFAWPLMFNGVVLFFGSQGDRIFIGHEVGLRELGLYSSVLMLINAPSNIATRALSAFHLPRISAEAGNAARQQQAASALGGVALLVSIGMSAGFTLVAPFAVPIIFGHVYAQSAFLLAAVGVLQTYRLIRLWPTTVALALGRSDLVLINNIIRLIAFPAAFLGVTLTHSLAGAVFGFSAGEFTAFGTATLMIGRASGWNVGRDMSRFATFAGVSAILVGWGYIVAHPSIAGVTGLAAASLGAVIWILRSEAESLQLGLQMLRQALPDRLKAS